MNRASNSLAMSLAALGLVSLLTGCASDRDTRNFRTEDASTNATVKGRLATESPIHLSQVGVDTADRTVYLSGAVPTFEDKARAETLAKESPGVDHVVNKIHVYPDSDFAIAHAIRTRYMTEHLWDPNDPGAITIEMRGDTAYLYGVAHSQEQKMRAESLAREVKGVKTVVNNIKVIEPYPIAPRVQRGTVDDGSLSAAIQERMAADRATNLAGVKVSTDGGIVYLNGNVPSPEQKMRAEQIAWEVRGVTKVVNNLEVKP